MSRQHLRSTALTNLTFSKVVDDCYLCDLCYMTKCPYVPPHEWAIDFPHLMLRAKAQRFKEKGASLRDKVLTSTDVVGKIGSIPVVSQVVNGANNSKILRKTLDVTIGIHRDAPIPTFHSRHSSKTYFTQDRVQRLRPIKLDCL